MNRYDVINRIAMLTGTNVNDYDDLNTAIIRRFNALFTQDIVQDTYNIKLYYDVVSKYFGEKGDYEKEGKYANMYVG